MFKVFIGYLFGTFSTLFTIAVLLSGKTKLAIIIDILALVVLFLGARRYNVKKQVEEDRIIFEEDTWYPCYFKPVGGQIKAHEVLDGLYNPSKKVFKLDPEFNKIKENWNSCLEDHVWLQDNVLEYTLKETK